MKAMLEFNLPDDKEDLDACMDAINGKVPEYKIDQLYYEVFRPIIKHGSFDGKELTKTKIDLIEQVWQRVRENLSGEV